MTKLLLVLTLLLAPSFAWAQCNGSFSNGQVCGVASGGPKLPGPVAYSAFAGFLPLAQNDIYVGNASNIGIAVPLSQDCTIVSSGAITCTKTNNVAFGSLATQSSVTGAQLPAPFTSGTASGNTSKFMTGTGTFTLNHAATFDGSGNIQDGGAATGTVTSVTCGQGLSGGTFTTTGTCAISLTTATNVLGADVALNNVSNYFDGPSMAQGTSGTWYASGSVTLIDTGSAEQFNCKLWDGTTVIASGKQTAAAANQNVVMSLSGILATPAANIRISCQDAATSGKIVFNASGNSKDSSIFGMRIQ